MIKKLLATTLATLSVASMSLPTMAVKTTDVNQEQHDNCLYSQQSNNNFSDFEIIEKEAITKYDTGELPLFETKEVKADNANDNFKFVDISANEEQRKAIDKESDRIKCLQDGNKSAGYLAIENNMLSLRNNVINTQDALKRFDVNTAGSKAINAVKDASYIIGDTALYPINGGLRYAYDNGLLTKAKDKIVNYVTNNLKNKALDYAGLGKKDNKKDSKVAKAFKWGKNVFNFFAK